MKPASSNSNSLKGSISATILIVIAILIGLVVPQYFWLAAILLIISVALVIRQISIVKQQSKQLSEINYLVKQLGQGQMTERITNFPAQSIFSELVRNLNTGLDSMEVYMNETTSAMHLSLIHI